MNGDLFFFVRFKAATRMHISMQATSERERRLTGLARGMRAAFVVPMLFAPALLVVKEPGTWPDLAVFGTFAHLVMVNFSTAGGAKIVGMRRTDPSWVRSR